MAYIKCPRCELNYIKVDVKMCDICKAELKLIPDTTFDLDDYEESIICPVCKKNCMEIDEYMCSFCRQKKEDLFVPDILDEDSENDQWREFLDDEKPVDIEDEELKILSLTELEDKEEEPVDEYEEEIFEDEDDFEDIGNIDEIEDFDDEDEDEVEDSEN